MEPNKKEAESFAGGGLSVAKVFLILAIATIIVAVVFWGISLGRSYQASSINKKLKDVNEETQGLGEINQKAQEIYNAEENIEALSSSKNYWSSFLASLAALTVKSVSLSELAADDEGNLTISGGAASYESLAKFISSLRGSGKFDQVVLESATLSEGEGGTPVGFSIIVTPNGTALTK